VDERTLLDGPRHGLAPTLPAAANDVLARRLVLLSCTAFLLAPGRSGVASTRALALSAAQGVVDGIHRHASDGGTLVLPAGATGLAERDQLMLGVAHHTDRALAGGWDQPHLAAGQTQGRHGALLGHQL